MAPLRIAGMAFKNKKLLQSMIDEVEKRGFYPEKVVKKACLEGGFDMMSPDIFNKSKREIRFNGVKYDKFEDLIKRHKDIEEKKLNYREDSD